MPPLYQGMVGQSTRQNTDMMSFANAIRKLSTAHKRVKNMDEVTKMKLQWAEETHRMQLASKDEELKFDRLKREEAEWKLNAMQEMAEKQQRQEEEARTSRGAAVESFLQFQRSGGAEGRDELDTALINMARSDPDFAKAYKAVVEGAVEAIQAPVEEKRGEALFQLKEKLANAQILSERAQTDQRTQMARKYGFEGDLAQIQRDEAYLEADAGVATTERYNKAKLAAINDTYLEVDIFGGVEGARKQYRDERDNKVKSAIEQRSGVMQRLGRLNKAIDLESIIDSFMATGGEFGPKLDEKLREKGRDPATDAEKQLASKILELDNQIRDARQEYSDQISYLDTIDNVANDLFDELVREQGYSVAEARTQVPSATVEIQKHLEPMLENIRTMQAKGNTIDVGVLLNEYERYINYPSYTLKPVHKDLLKTAFLKAALGQERKVQKSFMEVWGPAGEIKLDENKEEK